ARHVREATRLPMTVLGGAGSLADIGRLIECCGVVGAAAGSLFVFKGTYKAVLINYPNQSQKEHLTRSALSRGTPSRPAPPAEDADRLVDGSRPRAHAGLPT